MSILIGLLVLSLSFVANSVIYNYTVFCPANATIPCGGGNLAYFTYVQYFLDFYYYY
jgi:hypothetical protein